MTTFSLEQALYGSQGPSGYRFLARSPGFLDAWLAEAQQLCTRFGELPVGTPCPEALYVQPLGTKHVAVVRVADRGHDDGGRPGTLAFHLLVLGSEDYLRWGGDPFLLADRFPIDWTASTLARLECPTDAVPPRLVGPLQEILKGDHASTLLGAAQIIVDGGRLVLERPQPDAVLLRQLWQLLPTRTRATLWPATFALGNALDFHAVVVPRAHPATFVHHVTESQAGDYPEGRYELRLQIAIDAGDQRELDTVLARRTTADTRKLVWLLMGVVILIPLFANILQPTPHVAPATQSTQAKEANTLDLPRSEECPELSAAERETLTKRLKDLCERLHIAPVENPSAETLLDALDRKLGTPNPERKGRELFHLGPIQRQIRALLWKHEIASYNDRRLNTVELLDRLEAKVCPPSTEKMP